VLSLRPGSQRQYHRALTNYLVPPLCERRLVDLQPQHLQTLYGSPLAEGRATRTPMVTAAFSMADTRGLDRLKGDSTRVANRCRLE
jgi:hypothetical protein